MVWECFAERFVRPAALKAAWRPDAISAETSPAAEHARAPGLVSTGGKKVEPPCRPALALMALIANCYTAERLADQVTAVGRR